MLKKTIKYTDYNEVERTEDFYFNLSKPEIMEMQMGSVESLSDQITKVINAKAAPAIMQIFKKLVLTAYGEKSADGKHFEKSDKLSTSFSQTEAYSNLYMELATDATAAEDFVKGILPSDLNTIQKATPIDK